MSFINIIKSKIKIKSSKNNSPYFIQMEGLMKKLLLTIILCLFTAITFAEEKTPEDRIENLPGVWWEKIPAICVENNTLFDYAQRKELQPLNRSFGRPGGQPDGEIVYIVTYWVNIHSDQSMSSVMVPGANYSCVLYRTFDLELNPNFNWQPKVET